jgi:hypothetical protein
VDQYGTEYVSIYCGPKLQDVLADFSPRLSKSSRNRDYESGLSRISLGDHMP